MPYSNGLNSNIVQCLHDYDIPLYLGHTITNIIGKDRVESVVVAKVDEKNQPIAGTEINFDCDCVLLSVGLIPENELSRSANIDMDPRTNGPVVYENMETSIEGVFAAGNVVHVHDLVDYVSDESEKAGKAAGLYVQHGAVKSNDIVYTTPGKGVGYCVPQKIRKEAIDKGVELSFRVRSVYHNVEIRICDDEKEIAKFKREHMAPGEMERVVLPNVLFNRIHGQHLHIHIQKEGVQA